jgi:glycosyltransferase involved in cell wall biosynthesis
MKLAIVMPTYNHIYYTMQAVESLYKNTKSEFALIVIDDKSTDDTHEFFRQFGKGKKNLLYHQNKENAGVHVSWNEGLRIALALPADYIAMVNNDILFTEGWDVPLIEALLSNEYSLVSPMQTTGADLPHDYPTGNGRIKNGGSLDILGCCFMFKRKLVEEIGLFPEAMKYYFGDNWIEFHAKKRGKVDCIKESYIHHYFSISTSTLDNVYWLKKDGDEFIKFIQ